MNRMARVGATTLALSVGHLGHALVAGTVRSTMEDPLAAHAQALGPEQAAGAPEKPTENQRRLSPEGR